MKIIKPGFVILSAIDRDSILKHLEVCARTCYKSEDMISEDSAEKLVKSLIKRHHEAMIEHVTISVKFICDRGVSHELVRHRLASFAQESTRYCNYSKDSFGGEITVIEPFYLHKDGEGYKYWKDSCEQAEKAYFDMLTFGCTPQEARAVLPTSVKTEVVVTMNLRNWRHFFNLRALGTTGAPHPQMVEIAMPLLETFKNYLPEVFGDLEVNNE